MRGRYVGAFRHCRCRGKPTLGGRGDRTVNEAVSPAPAPAAARTERNGSERIERTTHETTSTSCQPTLRAREKARGCAGAAFVRAAVQGGGGSTRGAAPATRKTLFPIFGIYMHATRTISTQSREKLLITIIFK